MFSDETLECISIKSHAKTDVYIQEQLCQTKPIKEKEASCQTVNRNHVEVQTDFEAGFSPSSATRMRIDTSRQLSAFMLSVYPQMSEQLIANTRSRCFDGYQVDWEDEVVSEEITQLHRLHNKKKNDDENLSVTSLSWNATGSVVAAALSASDHDTWCTDQSFVHIWNIDRNNIDPDQAQTILECDTCLLDISFHPQQPALLAGGTFAGKLFIWDMSSEDNALVAYSGKDVLSHQEPISAVRWRPSTKLRVLELTTVGLDGCILVWEFNQIKKELKLLNKFLLLSGSISRSMKKQGSNSDLEMGISCLDFHLNDADIIYVGCENGGVFRCTLDAAKSRAVLNREKESYLAPQTKAYDGHTAAVNAIRLSLHLPEVFATCSSDMALHVYTAQEKAPLLRVEPITGEYLLSCDWSLCRASVIFVSTSNGKVLVLDLSLNTVAPVCVIDACDSEGSGVKELGVGVSCVLGNMRQRNLIGTGDGSGILRVWKLPGLYTQGNNTDVNFLNEIKHTE